jgi:hypothetical protein
MLKKKLFLKEERINGCTLDQIRGGGGGYNTITKKRNNGHLSFL